LPDTQGQEVPDFAGFLKSKHRLDRLLEREAALAELARYRGRFKAQNCWRNELYDLRVFAETNAGGYRSGMLTAIALEYRQHCVGRISRRA
jgi:hypothetical protein